MTDACPKCAYVRQPSDNAPAWQCPKCGIAYARYLELQQKAKERLEAGRDPERAAVRPAPPSTEARMVKGVLLALFLALAAGLIRHTFFRSHPEAPQTPAPATAAQAAPDAQPAAQPLAQASAAAPAPVSREPNLPVDTFKDLFITAHDQGQAESVMMVTRESHGVIGLNVNEPVKVHIDRREVLDMTACNRYGVTLTQGGDFPAMHENARGQMVKPARTRSTMHFVYSLSYCTDGTTPAGGAAIKVESQM